jgi:hypothetical protein
MERLWDHKMKDTKDLAIKAGFMFPASRHNYGIIDCDDYCDDNTIASYATFHEARDAYAEMLRETPDAHIAITGWNSGILGYNDFATAAWIDKTYPQDTSLIDNLTRFVELVLASR